MECPKFLPPEKDMDENIQWMKSQCRGCNCMRGGRNHFLTWMPCGRGIQTGFCLLQFLFLSARTAGARQICTKSSLIICKTLTGKKRLSRNLREQNSIRIKLLRDEWWRGESGNNKFKSVHLQAGELMQESGREKLTGGICYKYRIWDFPTYGVFWPVLDFSWALLHFDMWNRVWQTRKSTKHFSSQTKVPFSSPT